MAKQIIISVGREFGSGGHEIAEKLAKHYNIPLYDKEIFDHVAKKGDINPEVAKFYDEKPLNPIFYPVSMDGSYLPLEQTVANHIFDFIRQKGERDKESFVIVGRCAEYILRDNPNMVSVFILGDVESKKARVMEKFDLEEKAALNRMKKEDKVRKTYHNFYADGKWGDSRSYDLCINSSTVGIDKTLETIINFVDAYMEKL
ncbi:MAG: cytidylate kinase-like family protein [Lachnospiraceae bacterium]|jgi:cytidylate kinase|nr:cytidylate kinase-like family protein [Lachnospiraceae bacterium]